MRWMASSLQRVKESFLFIVGCWHIWYEQRRLPLNCLKVIHLRSPKLRHYFWQTRTIESLMPWVLSGRWALWFQKSSSWCRPSRSRTFPPCTFRFVDRHDPINIKSESNNKGCMRKWCSLVRPIITIYNVRNSLGKKHEFWNQANLRKSIRPPWDRVCSRYLSLDAAPLQASCPLMAQLQHSIWKLWASSFWLENYTKKGRDRSLTPHWKGKLFQFCHGRTIWCTVRALIF